MHRLPRRRLVVAALLLACPLYLGTVPNQLEIPRLLDAPASSSLVEILTAGDMRVAAHALAYPASYSAVELEADTEGVAGALKLLISHFGQVSKAATEPARVEFYEVGVGTGPQPFWWQATGSPVQTRQYIYKAHFSRFGPGFIKILTRTSPGGEQPVSIFFGLAVSLPRSKERVEAAYQEILDSVGLPAGHPARSLPVPKWQAPPTSQE